MQKEQNIGIVILAAGASKRMGEQKLLLELGDKTVIERCVETALASDIGPVAVVVGCEASRVAEVLAERPISVLENKRWAEGQSTSIICGVQHFLSCDAVIVVVGDQPFLEPTHLMRIMESFSKTEASILLSQVEGRRGNPALFKQEIFPELQKLKGDQGARQLFDLFEVAPIEQPDPQLFFDIDTPEAFSSAQQRWFEQKTSYEQFPLLLHASGSQEPFVYLDSAATTQVPSEVLAAQEYYETHSRANIHRGLYSLAERSSDAYEAARERVARFVGASPDGLVFTHGATEALNMVAFGWGVSHLQEGDRVLVDAAGHHANIVPWQMLAQRIGIILEYLDLDDQGKIQPGSWRALLAKRPKIAALTHISNVTGFENDLSALTQEAHDVGCLVVADCAQSAGHIPLDIPSVGVDFAAFSAHKMYGPFGIGCLYVAPHLREKISPFMGGGAMIERVDTEGFSPTTFPTCLEAGTPHITGAIGFAQACDYLDSLGLEFVAQHGASLCAYAQERLQELEGVRIVGGDAERRPSLLSFTVEGIHPHDIAATLSEQGIAVRAGHHCAMPLHSALHIPASIRVSFGVYSRKEDVDRLVEGIARAKELYLF